MMMTPRWLAVVPLALLFNPLPASAEVTGLDAIHAQARVGSKICMTEHEHYGEGSMQTRRAAELMAIRSWSGFTAFEYGRPWGSYRLAAGKRMECSNSGGSYMCKTWARPCRPARLGPPRR